MERYERCSARNCSPVKPLVYSLIIQLFHLFHFMHVFRGLLTTTDSGPNTDQFLPKCKNCASYLLILLPSYYSVLRKSKFGDIDQ